MDFVHPQYHLLFVLPSEEHVHGCAWGFGAVEEAAGAATAFCLRQCVTQDPPSQYGASLQRKLDFHFPFHMAAFVFSRVRFFFLGGGG